MLLLCAASVVSDSSPMKLREKLYLFAVGYYRSGDYSRSRDCIERLNRSGDRLTRSVYFSNSPAKL
ncbi:unnamed protein product [Thlaspi arvense]|uniref:Photosystem I assembly protein Ycf3 n=1 Tax=Thlaspi arvense TaxID=13288 RepID=A0AAU9RVP0_THLAR|nr:unnamed protein product [Thlaspi arvense]